MKIILKLEALALFGLGVVLFSRLEISGWWYAGLFFAPDLSMIGYLQSPRTGAWTYNLVHHLGTAVMVYLLGIWLGLPWLAFTGALLLGHSSFDRVLGYGLKYGDAFKHTHLGWIGKEQQAAGSG